MRTPKRLYAQQRLIYQPEWPTCPHCGEVLVMCNYLPWDKTVQTLDQVLSVASRPGRCPDETCPGAQLRLLSAEAQSIAASGSTYGYDVLVRIGWLRYQARATYTEIHRELASHVRISESHIRYLYQHLYLPLLACHERQHRDRLAQIADAQGGLMIALDGLAPQGGEPQIWFIRELTSGLTLRSGWLAQQDQTTFETFLRPLKQLEWPILAVLSDKQTGLMPAVRKVFPKSHYQFCQAHYLRNLAEPLADTDSAFKVDLRKAVRQQVGDLIRKEPKPETDSGGVLTITGLDLYAGRCWRVRAPKRAIQDVTERSRRGDRAASPPHALSAHAQRPAAFSSGGNRDLRTTRRRGPPQSRPVDPAL